MKLFFIFFLVILEIYCAKAQDIALKDRQVTIDTAGFIINRDYPINKLIRNRISQSSEDSDRVWKYYILAARNTFTHPDSALAYAQRGLDLAKKIQFEAGEFYCGQVISWTQIFNGNYTGSLAIEFNHLKQLKNSNNFYRAAWNQHNIGFAFFVGGDPKTGLLYIHNAWKLIESNSITFPWTAEVILVNTGAIFASLNKTDSAIYYIQKSLIIDGQFHFNWAGPYQNLAGIYFKRGEYEMSKKYSQLAYQAAKIMDPVILLDIIHSYIGLAKYFEKRGITDSALFYTNKAISEGKDFPGDLVESYSLLTKIYKAKHISDSALKYQEISLNLKDSVFNNEKSIQLQNFLFNDKQQQEELKQKLEQADLQHRNRLNISILVAGLLIFVIVSIGLWRKNIYKQKSYATLHKQKLEIDTQKAKVERTLEELKVTQSQLIQSEKMASLGEMTAGIAHEIQNPLNFVNNFSEVNAELLKEMKMEIDRGNLSEAKSMAETVIKNEEKIINHGRRADGIVKGMLQHSQLSTAIKEPTDINKLADEYFRLAYHGMRARDKNFNVKMESELDQHAGMVNIIPQDIGRVLLNLFNNAFYAVSEKKKLNPQDYDPFVGLTTQRLDHKIEISVKDNGPGIPQKIKNKIFQPFFTTRPAGQGTGLGLSLSYDIVKAHGGEITVNSVEKQGTEFFVRLPT
jgi:signal transduction histidine kinase